MNLGYILLIHDPSDGWVPDKDNSGRYFVGELPYVQSLALTAPRRTNGNTYAIALMSDPNIPVLIFKTGRELSPKSIVKTMERLINDAQYAMTGEQFADLLSQLSNLLEEQLSNTLDEEGESL